MAEVSRFWDVDGREALRCRGCTSYKSKQRLRGLEIRAARSEGCPSRYLFKTWFLAPFDSTCSWISTAKPVKTGCGRSCTCVAVIARYKRSFDQEAETVRGSCPKRPKECRLPGSSGFTDCPTSRFSRMRLAATISRCNGACPCTHKDQSARKQSQARRTKGRGATDSCGSR
jgi:hypothetical protein